MDYNFTATIQHTLAEIKEKDGAYNLVASASLEADQFLGMTQNNLSEDGTTRNVTIQIIPATDFTLPTGTYSANSGTFARGANEKKVSVTLLDATGTQIGLQECNYGL